MAKIVTALIIDIWLHKVVGGGGGWDTTITLFSKDHNHAPSIRSYRGTKVV